MIQTVTNIIKDVRKALDEIALNDSDFEAIQDDSELNAIIQHRIIEAADFIHFNADKTLMALDTATTTNFSAPEGDDAQATTIQVSTMLRFLLANADTWAYAVTDFCEEGSEDHRAAIDEYFPANTFRPCAVRCLNSFTLLPSATSTAFVRFIPTASIASNQVAIDKNLYSAFINYLAGITLLNQNDQRANELLALAYQQIGMEQKQQ